MRNFGKRLRTLALLGAAAAFGLAGCQDLDVDNPNAPDQELALASPGDVASLISSAYLNYHNNAQEYEPGNALSVGADAHTSSWGNFGMQDFGSEPRIAFNNNQNYTYSAVSEEPWFELYGGIVSASNGLRAIEEGLNVDNPERLRAFGKFVQGVSHGLIALIFDQGYIFDETVDPAAEQGFQPHDAVMDAALGYLDESIQIAESSSFEIPEDWMKVPGMNAERLARLAHSYKARFMASVPRSPSEAEAVDWNAVLNEIDQGIEQDQVHNTEGTGDGFWSGIKTLGGGEYNTWARVDLKQAGPADVSGEWENWVNTPVNDRQPFFVDTPDERFPTEGTDGAEGGYFIYLDNLAFPAERGSYHWSNYGDTRYEDYVFSCAQCWFGSYPEMTVTEMRMLEAEALMRTGDMAGAADLINVTRTANGGLPPVTADGVPEGENCVPKKVDLDALEGVTDSPCGDLWDALWYEKGLEVWRLSAGLAYFDDRRWGLLATGTPIHLPVAGQELENLQMENYTYGGVGGEDAAPAIEPGDMESILRRVSYDLEMLQRQQDLNDQKRASVTSKH